MGVCCQSRRFLLALMSLMSQMSLMSLFQTNSRQVSSHCYHYLLKAVQFLGLVWCHGGRVSCGCLLLSAAGHVRGARSCVVCRWGARGGHSSDA